MPAWMEQCLGAEWIPVYVWLGSFPGHWSEVKVAHSCPALCDPLDCTVQGILQARILEWVAFLFSRAFSQPRDRTQVSCITGGFFTDWATRDTLLGGLRRIKYRKCYDTIWTWWLTPWVVIVPEALWGADTQRPQPQGIPALKQSPGGHHQRPASGLRQQLFMAFCPVQISLNLPMKVSRVLLFSHPLKCELFP